MTPAPLNFTYPAGVNYSIVARPGGHPGFQVKYADANSLGTIMVDGAVHKLLQLHYHAPSEHTVNGKQYPLEVHFVHQKIGSTGAADLAVLGILYNYTTDGSHNAALDNFWFEIHRPVPILYGVSVTDMLAQGGQTYYRYPGSLTTPPCAETVKWHVMESTVGVNPLQKIVYQYALNGIDNFRPAQPLNGRTPTAYSR